MCVWPTALKLGCITNFDMLFLVMGFISLVDEIQFMLISSHHYLHKVYTCRSNDNVRIVAAFTLGLSEIHQKTQRCPKNVYDGLENVYYS